MSDTTGLDHQALELANKSIEQFAERTSQVTDSMRVGGHLAKAFDMMREAGERAAKVISDFKESVKDALVGLTQLRLPTDPKPAPLQQGSSDGIFKFYGGMEVLQNITNKIRYSMGDLNRALASGVNWIVDEFKHTASQLQDFGTNVAAGASKIFSKVQPYIAPALDAMRDAFQSVAINVAKFGAMAGAAFVDTVADISRGLEISLAALTGAMASVTRGFAKFSTAVGSVAGTIGQVMGLAIGAALKAVFDKVKWVIGSVLGNALSSFKSVASGGGPESHKEGGIATGSETTGAIGGIFQSATAMVAGPMAKLATGLIEGGNSIGEFVGALNPGLMIQFQRVLRDLNAVVGTALQPVMEAIVPLLREVGDAVYPIAKQFAAILKPFMEALQPLVSAFIQLAATVMEAFMPILDMIATALGGLAKMFTVVVDYWRTLLSGFMALVGAIFKGITGMDFADATKDFKEMLNDFAVGMKKVSNTLILLAAMLAKQFGADSFVKGLIDAVKVKPQGQAQGLAAAQNPQFQSIEALGKSMALQAAIATSGAPVKKNADEIGMDMVEELKKIDANGGNLADVLKNLPTTLQELPKNMALAFKELGIQAVQQGKEAVGNFVVKEAKREWEKPALQKVLEFVPAIRAANIGLRVAGFNGFGS